MLVARFTVSFFYFYRYCLTDSAAAVSAEVGLVSLPSGAGLPRPPRPRGQRPAVLQPFPQRERAPHPGLQPGPEPGQAVDPASH